MGGAPEAGALERLCSAALAPAMVLAFSHLQLVCSPSPAVEKLTPLSCSEWCLCQSAAVYGIMSNNPASLPSYPVISNVEKLVSSESNM